jgi:hypothetical protein
MDSLNTLWGLLAMPVIVLAGVATAIGTAIPIALMVESGHLLAAAGTWAAVTIFGTFVLGKAP